MSELQLSFLPPFVFSIKAVSSWLEADFQIQYTKIMISNHSLNVKLNGISWGVTSGLTSASDGETTGLVLSHLHYQQ